MSLGRGSQLACWQASQLGSQPSSQPAGWLASWLAGGAASQQAGQWDAGADGYLQACPPEPRMIEMWISGFFSKTKI